MKWKKEFIEHLSDELQITQIKIRESLSSWQGSPFEEEKSQMYSDDYVKDFIECGSTIGYKHQQNINELRRWENWKFTHPDFKKVYVKVDIGKAEVSPKHPIELVNEKYPDGWCIAICKEVINDLNTLYNKCYDLSAIYCGVFKGMSYSSHLGFGTLITKSEYLQLTGREPLQRDWTGTRFIISELVPEFKGQKNEILKDDVGYFIFIESYQKERYDVEEIEKAFAIGKWLELKDEPTTTHVQLPNVPHYGGNTNPFPPIRIIQHYNLSFELGNVIKYVLRKKGSKVEDLKKAIDYLNFEIQKIENANR